MKSDARDVFLATTPLAERVRQLAMAQDRSVASFLRVAREACISRAA